MGRGGGGERDHRVLCSVGAVTDWKMPSDDSTAFVAVASLVNTGDPKTRVSEGRLNDDAIGSVGK